MTAAELEVLRRRAAEAAAVLAEVRRERAALAANGGVDRGTQVLRDAEALATRTARAYDAARLQYAREHPASPVPAGPPRPSTSSSSGGFPWAIAIAVGLGLLVFSGRR